MDLRTLVSYHNTTRSYNPENLNTKHHRCESLKICNEVGIQFKMAALCPWGSIKGGEFLDCVTTIFSRRTLLYGVS
jgi:hypothetical protein